mmetsp:Transcript_62087/g.183490  ORF Transcript_62087/g.183490 Transcript_62087/m.183490 type:complete len:219 (+) Transcript_62087:666-1322(+)
MRSSASRYVNSRLPCTTSSGSDGTAPPDPRSLSFEMRAAADPSSPALTFTAVPIPRLAVCFVVLMTLRLLETQSDTQLALSPMKAERANVRSSSSFDVGGRVSLRKLYVRYQGKCPAAVAAALATAPWYSGEGPSSITLSFSRLSPSAPSTCIAVLEVSMGMQTILQSPAATLPAAVRRGRGRAAVSGMASRRARIPVLAAVSPKRVRGPCTRAKGRP